MRKFRIPIICTLIIIAVLQFTIITRSNAAIIRGSKNMDVVFLLDSSKSLRTTDPKDIRIIAIREFLALCHLQGDRIGVAAYSDSIVKESPLKEMNTEGDKQNYIKTLSSIQLGDWTDIGIGLKKAVEIMDTGHDPQNSPVIVLLSDGKNDPLRDKQLSINDINDGISFLKSKGYRVYTIGLNADGSVDKSQLNKISNESNGKAFVVNNANALNDIIEKIYADATGVTVNKEPGIIIGGAPQNYKITIPSQSVLEANLILKSRNGVSINKLINPMGVEQKLSPPDAFVSPDKNNKVLKILNPVQGDWNVVFTGTKGDILSVSMIFDYQIEIAMNLNKMTNIQRNDDIKVDSFLTVNNKKIEENELYRTLKATLQVKDMKDQKVKEIALKNNGGYFTGDFNVDKVCDYEFKVKYEGKNFNKTSQSIMVKAGNRQPLINSPIKDMKINKNSKNKMIDLSNVFSDPDNDLLIYKISVSDPKIVEVNESARNLNIKPLKTGNSMITVTADDCRGGTISQTFAVRVTSLLPIIIGIVSGLLLLILIILIIKLIKGGKVGKLYGNVMFQIRDEDGNTSTPEIKHFYATQKKVTVYQLLRLGTEFQELDKIVISGGRFNDSIIFTNKSSCTIEEYGMGSSDSGFVELNNGGKIAITLPGGQKTIILEYYF